MPAPPHPAPALFWRFWPLQCLGWLGVALVTLPIKVYFFNSWKMALAATFLREGMGFLLSSGLRPIYLRAKQRRTLREQPFYFVALALLCCLAAAAIDTVVLHQSPWSIQPPQMDRDHFLIGTFFYRAGLFAFWSILFFGIAIVQESQTRELAWREAEIRVLRAQINPHFFFNALNTLQMEKERSALEERIEQLAGYLRYSLRYRSQGNVPMAQEYEAAMNYLAIEKARFDDDLIITSHLDPQAAQAQVPGIILQPLLENAVKYGRRTSPPPLRIDLRVEKTDSWLTATVANSGHWITPDPTRPEGGVGLENLRQRLALLFGEHAHLEIEKQEETVTLRVRIPYLGVKLPTV